MASLLAVLTKSKEGDPVSTDTKMLFRTLTPLLERNGFTILPAAHSWLCSKVKVGEDGKIEVTHEGTRMPFHRDEMVLEEIYPPKQPHQKKQDLIVICSVVDLENRGPDRKKPLPKDPYITIATRKVIDQSNK